MKDFIIHLEEAFTHPKTRKDKLRCVQEYLNWLTSKELKLEEIAYKELLNFTGYLQDQGKAAYRCNHYLKAIEDYYAFKKISFTNKVLRVRKYKTTLKPLVELKDLMAIYECYQPKAVHDQLVLSLVIWQALQYEDIVGIELKDVQLTKGQVYIKSRKRRNARYLALAATQVMLLYDYINVTAGQRKASCNDHLLLNYKWWHWRRLCRDVRYQAGHKLNQTVRDLQYLRQSRLALWISEHGLRQAQYRAGFMSVAGTERYRRQSIKDLQQHLMRCHPLRDEP